MNTLMKTEVREIAHIPKEERPRERLCLRGPEYLSDQELLSVMIGSGIKGNTVQAISVELLKILDTNAEATLKDFISIRGMGKAKASQISAALEFCRRRIRPIHDRITMPRDVIPLISHYGNRRQEYFLSISLNGAHEVIQVRVVSMGLVNRTIVHPREVFADPLTDRATSLIVAHNHPSGNVEPSPEDKDITRRLKEAGDILGIQLLDHLIFSSENFFSFLENGLL